MSGAESNHDFYAFYNRVLRPEIARIEPLRRQTATRLVVITIATIAATVAWIMFLSKVLGLPSRLVGGACILPVGLGCAIWGPIWARYRDDYQSHLIVSIIRLYNGSFRYERNEGVGEVAFTDCSLFPGYLSREDRRCRGTDRVSGKVGVTPFEFSDLNVSVADGKSRKTIFNGVFFVADFNKNFTGTTFVTSRHALLHLWAVPATPSGEVVKLEDPEFERAFATHSTSQIEARYILSPALMRRILHFSEQSRAPIAIAFSGKSMFIAIYNGSTKLEPVLWSSLQKPSLFFGIWANLEFLCGIVNEMDLNTRIWTKGASAKERLPA